MHNAPHQNPAMIPLAPALSSPALAAPVLCAISLVASARPMQIQLPKISMPKLPKLPSLPSLPDLDLPNFGKKKASAPSSDAAPVAPPIRVGQVKVRAASGVVPSIAGDEDAPTFAEITGQVKTAGIAAGSGYKRFPSRRMPGANMDGWKEVAKGMMPKA